jgi:hypothetical protein
VALPRYAARRDENEPEIVDALRAAGWGVHRVSDAGFPDLVASRGKRVLLIEVVGDEKSKKFRKSQGLTPVQQEFHREWPGVIHIVRTVDEALAVAKAGRKR